MGGTGTAQRDEYPSLDGLAPFEECKREARKSQVSNETGGSVSATARNLNKFQQAYLRLLMLVAKESFAIKAAPHQSDPTPLGLIGVTSLTPEAV